jgi:DNA-binding MarR family transcriptional regulator
MPMPRSRTSGSPVSASASAPTATPPRLTASPPLEGLAAAPPDPARPLGAEQIAGVPRGQIVGVSELLLRFILANRAVERNSPSSSGGPGLSPHAVRAAMHLFQHGQGTVGELAEGLGVSMGWASRIADELERAGHIRRERDPLDRRVVRLRLSAHFAQMAQELYQQRGSAVAAALATLRPEERDVVGRFLNRLIEGFETLAGTAPPAAD